MIVPVIGTALLTLRVLSAPDLSVGVRAAAAPPPTLRAIAWRTVAAAPERPSLDMAQLADGAEDADPSVQAEQRRAAALADRLAEAQRNVAALQQRLDKEQAQAAGRELAAAREQLAQAERLRATEEALRQSFDASLKDKDASLKDKEAQFQAEKNRGAALAERLAAIERNAPAQLAGLGKQLADEQARASARDRDLAVARDELAQSVKQRAADVAALQSVEAALKDREARLKAAQLEIARGEDVQKQLRAEQAKTAALNGSVAALREQLAQASEGARDAGRAGQASDATAKQQDALHAEQGRVAALAQRLAEAEREAAASVEAFNKQLLAERMRSAIVEHDLLAARSQAARALQQPDNAAVRSAMPRQGEPVRAPATDEAAPVGSGEAAAPPSKAPPTTAPLRANALPSVAPHLVLRYARDNDAARRRATSLKAALQAKGLDVDEPVETRRARSGSHVVYFYRDDRSTAKGLAGELALSAPKRSRPTNPPPRPGTIEVLIGG